jgi:type IV secretion system protein VirB6
MATSSHFYEDIFSTVNNSLTTYVGDVATNVITAITPTATTLLLIYVMLWGWATMRGMISEPVTDGINRIVRLSLITGLALNIGRYNDYLSNFLWDTPDAMAAVVASGYSSSTDNTQYLDNLWSQIYDIGYAFWNLAGTFNVFQTIGLMLLAYFIWFAGAGVTLYAFFLLILSKIALAVLLGIGPIFVLLIMFEPTKRFFDVWMGQVLNYVFLVILTSAAMKLMLTIFNTYLGAVVASGFVANPQIPQAFPTIIFSAVCILVLNQVPSIASALGGGVAIGTLGAVGWAYGKAKGGMTAVRPTELRRSYNKAAADVRLAAGAARATAGLPASVYRKITGSNVNRIAK